MRVVGIDPGVKGAFAFFSPLVLLPPGFTSTAEKPTPAIYAWDMPVNDVSIGGKPRKRIDRLGLSELIDQIEMIYCPEKWIVEKVGGIAGQSAASGFEFGYTVGCIHQALSDKAIAFETVTPTEWKKDVKAPKDKTACVAKCDDLWPYARGLFRDTSKSAKGAVRPDRAEAALLAYWRSGAWK